jgi:eukaryotic-like serine/threonine-protein kinase
MTEDPQDRDPLEALASEYLQSQRRGEAPDVEDYARRHPDLADEIRDLFPAMLEMERLKTDIQGSDAVGPPAGGHLGDFHLIREIGRGGMGVVYEAEQESLGRRVAVKVLPSRMLPDPKHLLRFRREAQVAAGLHHTNIVQVFGVGQAEGYHFYVMQYIRGAGVDEVIARLRVLRSADSQAPSRPDHPNESRLARLCGHLLANGEASGGSVQPLTPRSAYWHSVARIAAQAADALAYAHRQGVLHRDVKPANFLLDEQADLWVTDFGLAKATRSEDLTTPTDVTGTLPYVPPERFRGEYDERSDVYGLGLTLYELLTLRRAFDDGDRTRLMRRIVENEPAGPRKIEPAVPRDLETIALKACAREPAHRYASAEAMALDLHRFLENRPIEARRIGPIERFGRWARRNPVVAGLTAAVLVLMLLVAAVASAGYVRATAALQREAEQRGRAETIADITLEALDRMFERFAPRAAAPRELTVGDADEETAEVAAPPVLSRQAAALLQEMLPYYDRLAKVVADEENIREKTARAHRRVGDIQALLGEYELAATAYGRSEEAYIQLQLATGRADLVLEIARVCNDLGRLQSSSHRTEEALESHQRAMNMLAISLDGASGSPEERFELARTHYLLAIAPRSREAAGPGVVPPGPMRGGRGPREGRGPVPGPMRRGPGGRRGGAEPPPRQGQGRGVQLRDATDLLEGLLEQAPTDPRYRHFLALCYRERGPRRWWSRRGTEDTLTQAIELLEGLVEEFPREPEYQYDLAEALAREDVPPGAPGMLPDSAEAEGRLRRSLSLSERLVSDHPNIPRYASGQAHTLHRLAMLLSETLRDKEAEALLRRAVGLQESLVAQFGAGAYDRVWLGVFQGSLAQVLMHSGQEDQAREIMEATNIMLQALLTEQPDLWYLRELIRRNREFLNGSPGLLPPTP